MKGRQIVYSTEELAFCEARQTMPRRQLHAAFVQAFGRDDVSVDNFKAMCTRKGWKTGRTGCFPKGNEPYNRGKQHTGAQHPNSVASRFKKGNRTGQANLNYKPIGTERVSDDGYLERKVHDNLPLQSRWQLVHKLNWEAINGPVPKGMALKCIDDRLNTDPSNWQLIPRSLLPRLNGGRHKARIAYDAAPTELKPTIMAVAKLEQGIHEKRKASA